MDEKEGFERRKDQHARGGGEEDCIFHDRLPPFYITVFKRGVGLVWGLLYIYIYIPFSFVDRQVGRRAGGRAVVYAFLERLAKRSFYLGRNIFKYSNVYMIQYTVTFDVLFSSYSPTQLALEEYRRPHRPGEVLHEYTHNPTHNSPTITEATNQPTHFCKRKQKNLSQDENENCRPCRSWLNFGMWEGEE